MEVTYDSNDGVRTVGGLTLAEQTRDHVFLEDEDGEYENRFEGATLERVTGCESIGIINFAEDGVRDIPETYISEPIDEAVYLAPVDTAEQQDDMVYVEMRDGTVLRLAGELDRAYTY